MRGGSSDRQREGSQRIKLDFYKQSAGKDDSNVKVVLMEVARKTSQYREGKGNNKYRSGGGLSPAPLQHR